MFVAGATHVRRTILACVLSMLLPQAAQAQWMGELWDDPDVGPQWRQTRLSDVVFPGTHDSGTYNLSGPESPLGDELDAADALLGPAMVLAGALGLTDAVAEAQSTDVGQQLADGVRALDIRTYYDAVSGRLHITHSFKGPPLSEILADLAAFVDDPANAREIIVFQFSNASADIARDRIPGLNERVIREIFDYRLPSGGTLGERFIPWDVPGALRRWRTSNHPVTGLAGVTALSDPTVEQALATGGQIIFTATRSRYEAFGDRHGEDVYAKLWENPSREADFYGALTRGEYPAWIYWNTEGRAFDLASTVAAERTPLTLMTGAPAPSSHRYLRPIGLHSGVNAYDLRSFLALGNPYTLAGYATQLNPEIIPQLASLPRDQVNIVELDHYRSWMTPWFVALNRGVVRIETGPNDAAGPAAVVFQETTDAGDASGDPDFYPWYISGDLGRAFYAGGPYRVVTEPASYHPDIGGGDYVTVLDRRAITFDRTQAVGGWEYRRFAEVHATSPEHLIIGFAENDSTSGDDYVSISPTRGYWNYHVDLRSRVDRAVGPAPRGGPLDTGAIFASGNVAYAESVGEHAAQFVFRHRLCEWGVNCPEDGPRVVDPWDIGIVGFPALRVAEGQILPLSTYGQDSVYSSAVAGLYWDTSPDGAPYSHTSPSALASFDASGLAPGEYQISLAIIRTSTDVTGVLDSLVYYVNVCSDWDADGLIDGGPNFFRCPGDDEDDDGDEVLDGEDRCPFFDDRLDADADGVPDGCDLCGGDDRAGDADADSVCDDLDACPDADDTLDADADGVPDGCDICASGDDALDADSDGVPDGCDICASGDDALDADSDGVPDGCDVCALGDDALDADSDGVPDGCDICALGDDALDGDSDGVPDGCDDCMGDDASGDSDDDGVCDDLDACAGDDVTCDADAGPGDPVPGDAGPNDAGERDGGVSDVDGGSVVVAATGCGCRAGGGGRGSGLSALVALALLLSLRRGRGARASAAEPLRKPFR
jgi:hypothetical protein